MKNSYLAQLNCNTAYCNKPNNKLIKPHSQKLARSITLVLASTLLCTISGCQSMSAGDDYSVMQRSNKVFETTGYGSSKAKAKRDALKNASGSCQQLAPIVISDTMTYNGLVDEKLVRIADQAGSIAGSVVGISTPDLFRDDDYEFTINFKCQ